jgi:hypothetical protein
MHQGETQLIPLQSFSVSIHPAQREKEREEESKAMASIKTSKYNTIQQIKTRTNIPSTLLKSLPLLSFPIIT